MALLDSHQDPRDVIPESIFRAYDIRGIVESELSEANVRLIARAIGSEAIDQGIRHLLVAFDGRLSSPVLSQSLINGLLNTGCDVTNLGCAPTPLLYFGTYFTDIGSGVMLTASHNPANYNGLKIVFNQACLADNQIQLLKQRIEQGRFHAGKGRLHEQNLVADYIATIDEIISLQRRPRVVIDCGNAVPGLIAPTLFSSIGCEVIPLYCEVDGHFPNHHPDPTVPENLVALAELVIESGADLGIAFDGDGDRLGLIDEKGQFVNADSLLQLLVADIAARHPGASIVFDVKCSTRLARLIENLGCKPVMHRSGHSFMKQAMQETGAPLGGEFAAHIFLKDRWYGFDDGLYTAARILELLSRSPAPVSEQFAPFQGGFSTAEISIPVTEEEKFGLMANIEAAADFPDASVITIDGLRVEFEDGWGLIRASNTSPALLLRFEADNLARLTAIQTRFKALIAKADNSLNLDF
ncbi:MAG: phosphomannomutase/phosphoglucomutase [Gammaproteobacteria bacterium]